MLVAKRRGRGSRWQRWRALRCTTVKDFAFCLSFSLSLSVCLYSRILFTGNSSSSSSSSSSYKLLTGLTIYRPYPTQTVPSPLTPAWLNWIQVNSVESVEWWEEQTDKAGHKSINDGLSRNWPFNIHRWIDEPMLVSVTTTREREREREEGVAPTGSPGSKPGSNGVKPLSCCT